MLVLYVTSQICHSHIPENTLIKQSRISCTSTHDSTRVLEWLPWISEIKLNLLLQNYTMTSLASRDITKEHTAHTIKHQV